MYKCRYSCRKVKAAVENIEAVGLLAEHDKKDPSSRNRGRQSTLRLCDDARVIVLEVTGGRRRIIRPLSSIVMRDVKKRLTAFDPAAEPVRIIKGFNERHDEMVRAMRVTGAEVGRMVAVFNNSSLYEGGRGYAPHQNGLKKDRHLLLIDGEPTVGHDYVSIHPALLYALLGLAIPVDCYAIPGFDQDRDRGRLKMVLVIVINAASKRKAVMKIAAELENEERKEKAERRGLVLEPGWKLKRGEKIPPWHLKTAQLLTAAVERHHAPIARAFYSGAGTWLQNIDARIGRAVMSLLMDRGIPVLSYHDGFRVQARYGDVLKEAMHRMARAVQGAALQTKPER